MSNKPILYNLDLSPPVRAVKIVAKLLDVELELRDVDLFKGEHLQEPFVKINPEHTVPTLDDNGTIIWDSHTICAYLVDKYGKNDSLYPKDLAVRARVNQRLFFNASSLFVRLRDASVLVFWKGGKEIPQDRIDPVYAAYDVLEAFLATDPFLVGSHLTIADICAALSLGPLDKWAPRNSKYPKIDAWLGRIRKAIPFFGEYNDKFVETYAKLLQEKIETNKSK